MTLLKVFEENPICFGVKIMESQELITPPNITFALGILAIIFSVFNYFRKPQEDLEKNQAINDERDKSKATVLAQKEVEGKASLLAQQVKSDKEDNNRRFLELGEKIDKSMTLAQNHIHTVDTKVDNLAKEVGTLGIQITKLATIIDERIPRKG